MSKKAQAAPWKNRIVGSGAEAPDQLVANPKNWRRHPNVQRQAIRGALTEVGWVQQVIVNKRTGNLVDGHARVEEALRAEAPEVPVLYVDLSPEEEALVLATLDPIGSMAAIAGDRFAELMAEVTITDEGLQDMVDRLAKKSGITDDYALSPDLFADPESGMVTDYRCPRCGHEWSGKAKP